jgi:hypothetical protein
LRLHLRFSLTVLGFSLSLLAFTKVVGGHGICSFHSLVHAALPIHFKFVRTVRHGAAWLFARSLRLHLRFSLKRVILVWSMGLFHFWSPQASLGHGTKG